jgi:hypothetical protein
MLRSLVFSLLILVQLSFLCTSCEAVGVKFFDQPWSCNNFTAGPCTSAQALDLTNPSYRLLEMPIILVVNSTRDIKVCISDAIVINNDLSLCNPENLVYFFLPRSSSSSSHQGSYYVTNTTSLPQNKVYYLQAFPVDENDQFETDFSLEAYYRGQCWAQSPYQNIYGECTSYINLSSSPANSVKVYPLVPVLFRSILPGNVSSMKLVVTPSNPSGTILNYLFLWARKGVVPLYNQLSKDESLEFDYKAIVSKDGRTLELQVDTPSQDSEGWFFSLMSYKEVSISYAFNFTTCNTSSSYMVGKNCNKVPLDITHFGGNISLPIQTFYASLFDGNTVLMLRNPNLVVGVSSADFSKPPPRIYASWNYVPSDNIYDIASLKVDSPSNFLSASAVVNSNSSLESMGAWYIVVPRVNYDWVLWANEPCPSNCSNAGVCIPSVGYCYCTGKKTSGVDCSVVNNSEYIYVPIVVTASLIAGFVVAICIGIRRRREASYERV